MSLKVKGLLTQKRKDVLNKVQCMSGVSGELNDSHGRVLNIHMDGSEWATNWDDMEACINYRGEKGVAVDDTCFNQVTNLRKFTEMCNHDEEFSGLQVHQKWTKYFEKAKSIACYSELLTIAQFVFALPSHNANVERVFSIMQSQGAEPALCRVTKGDSTSSVQLQRHVLQRLSCLFVKLSKTARKALQQNMDRLTRRMKKRTKDEKSRF